MFYNEQEKYMHQSLLLAQEAGNCGEAPIGCIIVDINGKIIGHGRNNREAQNNATAHAEIEAIRDACKNIGDWRLDGCSMFVTLEPCPMCAGAVIMSRLCSLYYGAKDNLTGSCGSIINLFMEPYGHKVSITGGILENECSQLLSDFFRQLRK